MHPVQVATHTKPSLTPGECKSTTHDSLCVSLSGHTGFWCRTDSTVEALWACGGERAEGGERESKAVSVCVKQSQRSSQCKYATGLPGIEQGRDQELTRWRGRKAKKVMVMVSEAEKTLQNVKC